MKTKRCTWDAERGWLTPEHQRDCNDGGCAGCRPCPRTHCALRGRCASHVDAAAGIITCPSCIGSVRRDIATIVDLYAVALPEEATLAGIDSEAFNLIGPAASAEQIDGRKRAGQDIESDPHHPYRVLGDAEMALREIYGPPTQLFITVVSAANYLTGLLAGPFPHGDEFEDFAKQIAACRSHLEAVIHDSRTPELGRPCPRCAEESEDGKAPRLRKRYASGADEDTAAGENDTWHCPNDAEHWWSERDYRDRVAADYQDHADELPARELATRIGVPLSTIRKWCARRWDDDASEYVDPMLKPCRRGTDGRKVYRVNDAMRLAGMDSACVG